jgi:hypothetical protein
VNASAQVENANTPMTRDKLAQGNVDRLPLRARPDQPLRLAKDTVIDLDVRSHTPEYTPCQVYV